MADSKGGDYKLKLKLDLSELEADSKKIARAIKRGASASSSNLDGEVKKRKESLRLTERQTLALEKQQKSLERSIKRARRQGVGGLGSIERAASSGDALKIGRAQALLADKVLNHQHRSLDIRSKSLAKTRAQQTLDAENYRIWQLRQEGEARRAKQAAREAAANSRAGGATRQVAGSAKLSKDVEWRLKDANRITNPKMASARDDIKARLSSIGDKARVATDAGQVMELRKQYQAASSALRELINDQRRMNSELRRAGPIAAKFGATVKSAVLGMASAYALLEGARAVYRIGAEMDAMRASLLAASGTSEQAANNFEFIKATAKDLGKDVQTLTGGFNRLGVAMTAQGYTAEETKAAFLSVVESATAFSLSSERTGNIILAMSQMVS